MNLFSEEYLLAKLAENTQLNMERINVYNEQLNGVLAGIEDKVALVLKKQQTDFLASYSRWVHV